MSGLSITPIAVGDRVRLRKPHPCGGFEWTISRVGADIGMKCATCGRRAMVTRREFEKRLKAVVSRADGPPPGADEENDRAPGQ
jgi:hypothetical protein